MAFLRGINVGGHHKVPMAELRNELGKLHLKKVETLLNSGNIIFETAKKDTAALEKTIACHLEKSFGFPIPTILREAENIYDMEIHDPFKEVPMTKDIRLYVSLLRNKAPNDLQLPWRTTDNSYQIIAVRNKTIFSILNLSISKTPKAMEALERNFGTDITTRNWNTIKRILLKLESDS